MGALKLLREDDMSLYEPPPAKRTQLSVRIPEKTLLGLEAVVRLWRLLAEARGDDVEQVDRTFVITRLLAVGTDQAFAEFGGRPTTDAQWKEVEASVRRAVEKSKR